MGTVIISDETTKFPITLIGRMAGLCYGSDTSDEEKNYKRGLNCIKDGHGRVLEFPDIYVSIEGYSARVIRELYTHIGGAPTRLQSSTRYIDYSNFDYIVPRTVKSNAAAEEIYKGCVQNIQYNISKLIHNCDIVKEDAAMLLPLGMTTNVSGKYNGRTLGAMAEQRLCTRAYWEFRQLMRDWEKALRGYSEEWNTLCDYIFVCKCDKAGYCLESHGCGLYPQPDNR